MKTPTMEECVKQWEEYLALKSELAPKIARNAAIVYGELVEDQPPEPAEEVQKRLQGYVKEMEEIIAGLKAHREMTDDGSDGD